jgi:para-aminobenzoate synthetase component 1
VIEPQIQGRELTGQFIHFADELGGRAVTFSEPVETISANEPADLVELLDDLERWRKQGRWCAGYVSYEAGFALEPALRDYLPSERKTPLACFGVFDGPSTELWKSDRTDGKLVEMTPAWSEEAYTQRFDRLRQNLFAGDCFQANLTFPITGKWSGSAAGIFNQLAEVQKVGHAAFVHLDDTFILSRSPELFFKISADRWLESWPMKGTAPRSEDSVSDRKLASDLENDPKNRSENIMIVDLLRNDISRIAEEGTVDVPKLLEVQSFSTVHQMISRVRGRLLDGTTIRAVFEALFPCGSITGAPKIRAMQILSELEGLARNVYCGAIGWIEPSGAMRFNVPIRTFSLYPDKTAEFNVGGGITLGSTADGEYEECVLKARFAEKVLCKPSPILA